MPAIAETSFVDPTGLEGAVRRIAVIGYGLIGGSLARAVHARSATNQVRIWDPEDAARRVATEQIGAKCVATSLSAAVAGAELVVIAVPTRFFAAVFRDVMAAAGPATVVSDVASVKGAIVDAVRGLPLQQLSRFVPAHPIAGSEQSGAAYSRPDLFTNCQLILSPMQETAAGPLQAVFEFWRDLQTRVTVMSPKAHDEVYSAVSHFPHLLAFAYLGALAASNAGHDYAAMAGPGFRDFTRIAGSDQMLWADICVSNRQALLNDIGNFRREFEHLCTLLGEGDRVGLSERFAAGRQLRLAFERHAATAA
ncbi:prephenate dehydrogenase [Piscinibacter sakaiensis]|uniref:prephenate dehydrogenase n=1 Tax=Piscinibacter sakaiensis TaxID=1547922 RepID=UPI003AABB447